MSTNVESPQGIDSWALDALGQALGFVAAGAALVLLWGFALTSGGGVRVWSPTRRT